jgi:hypothetical protein
MNLKSFSSALALLAFLALSGATSLLAQSRPFTTDYPLGSKTLTRSSYSPLSSTAQVSAAYLGALGRKAAAYEMAHWLRDAKPGLQSRVLPEAPTSDLSTGCKPRS